MTKLTIPQIFKTMRFISKEIWQSKVAKKWYWLPASTANRTDLEGWLICGRRKERFSESVDGRCPFPTDSSFAKIAQSVDEEKAPSCARHNPTQHCSEIAGYNIPSPGEQLNSTWFLTNHFYP